MTLDAQKAQWMKRAIELSRINMEKGIGGPFGAVIVKDGKIIGEGWNQVTSTNDPTAHAEVSAIRDACKNLKNFDLSGAEIYTSCEPCPMCLSAIYWARLNKIYFANTKDDAASIQFDDDFIYQQIATPPEARSIPREPLLRHDALAVFQAWEEKADKIRY
jgi:guanine deaminase